MSLDSFRDILAPIFGFRSRGSGGRRPDAENQPSLDVALDELPDKTWLTPCQPGEARLTVVQITDVSLLLLAASQVQCSAVFAGQTNTRRMPFFFSFLR